MKIIAYAATGTNRRYLPCALAFSNGGTLTNCPSAIKKKCPWASEGELGDNNTYCFSQATDHQYAQSIVPDIWTHISSIISPQFNNNRKQDKGAILKQWWQYV